MSKEEITILILLLNFQTKDNVIQIWLLSYEIQ